MICCPYGQTITSSERKNSRPNLKPTRITAMKHSMLMCLILSAALAGCNRADESPGADATKVTPSGTASPAAEAARDSAGQAVESAGDAATSAGEALKQGTQDTVRDIRESTRELTGEARDATRDAADATKDAVTK